MRNFFNQQLDELKTETLRMGSMVEDELKLALQALASLDRDLARQVFEADKVINDLRFELEARCTKIIGTQQPVTQDLRCILAALNMIVDLERMGDQAKGIAKALPGILKYPDQTLLPDLQHMGDEAIQMLKMAMEAYTTEDIELAQKVVDRDERVDRFFNQILSEIMKRVVASQNTPAVEAYYKLLLVARELERFGDLAANVAHRVIYMATGFISNPYLAEPARERVRA
ncbi:MAG TPA: phosphate signaling complex protein PhoU [Anaerolineae bacterium]|nr:phosphate signaling complex protein PhoU [Anaerolineae bacterium]HMR64130.1 phosphate signaling complex protein PhoU [Anaerolineae bacterium]